MPISENTLEKYIAQLRRTEKSRLAGVERNIRRIYRALMKDLTAFVGEEYQKYAREDKLTVDILQEKRRYARFLEEATKYIDKSVPEAMKLVEKTVEDSYKACYEGMGKAVSQRSEVLKDAGAMTVRLEVLKRAIENPISGLTLPDTLQKHRQEVIYNIKQQLNIGLLNGDSYVTMAKRINKVLSGDDGTGGAYGKAMNIVRTEAHRVREAGFLDCAENLAEGIEAQGLIYAATWRTMKDEKVRPKTRTHSSKGWRTVIRGSANHEKMEGVTIKVGEEFDLGGGVKTKCPGMSGDAANDCNCRCYLEYNLMTAEQFAKITGKNVTKVKKAVAKSSESGIINKYEGKSIEVVSDTDISAETISKIENATKHISDDFSVITSCSEPIKFGYADGALAENRYSTETGLNNITLNKNAFSDIDSLYKKLKSDYKSGESYDTDYVESLVAHEFGHNIHVALSLKRAGLQYGKSLSVSERELFAREYSKILQEIYIAAFTDETFEEIQDICVKQLGEMTRNNPRELIAQSFGNYYYGKKRCRIAEKIVMYFKKELG